MITLPVTAQMYHQLVQQQMPSNENTVCVTPMQVQNIVTNNVCTNVSNSNFNPPTTYVMSPCNRNVINFPFQGTAVGHIKNALSNNLSTINQKFNPIQSHTIVEKTYYKKKILNFSKDNQKSVKLEFKKSLNNNSEIIKNRNQKLDSTQAESKHVLKHEDVEKPRKKFDDKNENLKVLTGHLKKEES